VRFGASDYDPQVGRWTAKDPLRFGGGSTLLYSYVSDAPTNQTESTGLFDGLTPKGAEAAAALARSLLNSAPAAGGGLSGALLGARPGPTICQFAACYRGCMQDAGC
jgi:hypothetical protein